MREHIEKYKWYIGAAIVLVIVLGVWLALKPTYPDKFTPKPLKGKPDASVRIVEFSDLQCPACSAAHPVTTRIMEEYGDRVSLEYKHFPLAFHRFAFDAAMASECANDQGLFWEYVETAFTNQDQLDKAHLKQYGEDVGVADRDAFNACLDTKAKEKYVKADMNEGIGKGVPGTPSFYINGVKLESWQYDDFKAALDAALAEE